jgi:NmrA-like family
LEDVETISGGMIHSWHFTVKRRIETYAKEHNVPYTFVRYAFYFQDFGSFFQPDEQGQFFMAMKDHVLDAVDTEDASKAIAAIFKEGPSVWSGKEIGLASDSLLVQEYLDIIIELKKDGIERKYVAVPWEEMAKDPNSKDLAEMFCFYTDYDKQCIRDVEATKKLCPGLRSFRQWAEVAVAEGKL